MTTIAGASEKGGSYINQDTYFIQSQEGIQVLGVFDGHNLHGKKAADLAKNIVEKFFAEEKGLHGWSKENWATNMKKLFHKIHSTMKELFQIKKGKCKTKKWKYGGTTATIVVVIHNDDGSHDVITSNVGDSTAMVFTKDSDYKFLSENHNPDSKKEFERIRDLDSKEYPEKLQLVYNTQIEYKKIFDDDGNKIKKFLSNPWRNGLFPMNVRHEPATLAVGGSEIAIAMTRSLGDFRGEKFGLSHEPAVTFKKAPKDCIICVASDGLWDNWKYEDFSSYLTKLKKDNSVESVLAKTMKETMHRGITNFKEKFDDTTCVLCFL